MPFLCLLSICPGIYISSGYCANPLSRSRTKWKDIPTLSYECLLPIFQCIRLMLKIRTYVACLAYSLLRPSKWQFSHVGPVFELRTSISIGILLKYTVHINGARVKWTVICENCRCSIENNVSAEFWKGYKWSKIDLGPISSIKFVRYILNCAYVVYWEVRASVSSKHLKLFVRTKICVSLKTSYL